MQKGNKGFTLIELLVVIAIIGILSGIVLTSLGQARNKGKDASAQASMSSMRAEAEVNANSDGTYPDTLCTPSTGELAGLISAVETQTGNSVDCEVSDDNNSWIAAVELNNGNFCVDSAGFAGAGTRANATDFTCTAE